jgi:hypothetical protein
MFYETASAEAKAFAEALLKKIPELRDVTIVFNYKENLNNGIDSAGVWALAEEKLNLPTVITSIAQMFRLVEHKFTTGLLLLKELEKEAIRLSQEVIQSEQKKRSERAG